MEIKIIDNFEIILLIFCFVEFQIDFRPDVKLLDSGSGGQIS